MKPNEDTAIAHVLAAAHSMRNGDDCALVPVPGGGTICVTTDTAIEGVHLATQLTPWQMGYRAAACALSDIAAMGATPIAILCALEVPEGNWQLAPTVVAGAAARAREASTELVGGDMVATGQGVGRGWAVTITAMGSAPGSGHGGYVMRSGANVGDAVFVTGTLGTAAVGLHALRDPFSDTSGERAATNRYIAPPSRIRAARVIAQHATAMMDISDGIASDVPRLANASGVGIEIDLDRLPVPELDELHRACSGIDPFVAAATWGDDYELLFTVNPAKAATIRQEIMRIDPRLALTRIGDVADIGITFLRNGEQLRELRGFVHG